MTNTLIASEIIRHRNVEAAKGMLNRASRDPEFRSTEEAEAYELLENFLNN